MTGLSPGRTLLSLSLAHLKIRRAYSRARQMSVIVVLDVSGNHTGCLVTKRCTAYGRRGLFVQLVGSDIITQLISKQRVGPTTLIPNTFNAHILS